MNVKPGQKVRVKAIQAFWENLPDKERAPRADKPRYAAYNALVSTGPAGIYPTNNIGGPITSKRFRDWWAEQKPDKRASSAGSRELAIIKTPTASGMGSSLQLLRSIGAAA